MFSNGRKINALKKELASAKSDVFDSISSLNAINKSMAVIEFNPNGTIISANDNFVSTMGYPLNEIRNRHHSMFCSTHYAQSEDYKTFWQDINQGKFQSGQFERLTKTGNSIWLEASYNPIYDQNKNLIKVIKFATEISKKVEESQEQQSIINAISRSMAMIEFDTSGKILTANENFLNTTQYQLNEIIGRHHKMFCEDSLVKSQEYASFWDELNRGNFKSGRYKRIDKQGNVIWLEASYNPIFDVGGKLTKVVKFATNITEQVLSAKEARKIAVSTSEEADLSAQKGMDIVQDTVSLMDNLSNDVTSAAESLEALNTQADKINNIVNTISGIADQTNLLALNAAIEAARAGEQGRGFAVVADEVRQLAARTSSSTTEIADVVKKNVELSSQATKSMSQSTEQIDNCSELIENLNVTITNINAGVSAIGEAVERLNN